MVFLFFSLSVTLFSYRQLIIYEYAPPKAFSLRRHTLNIRI